MDKFSKRITRKRPEIKDSYYVLVNKKAVKKIKLKPTPNKRVKCAKSQSKLRIIVYCVCRNEEDIINYYIKHYLEFANKIIFYDNMSNDNTRAIINSYDSTEIRDFNTGNELDQRALVKLKNNCYKEQTEADFCIITDADEFLYHPHISTILSDYKDKGITLPLVSGYDMIGEEDKTFLDPKKLLTAQIKHGVINNMYSKRVIFSPKIDIRFRPGCHHCDPVGLVKSNTTSQLKLLHYKYITLQNALKRIKIGGPRRSHHDRLRGWGHHKAQSEQVASAHYHKLRKKRIKVI